AQAGTMAAASRPAPRRAQHGKSGSRERSLGKYPQPAARARRDVGRGRGNLQVQLGAEPELAPHVEMTADERGTLVHARQSKMSAPVLIQHRGIDALAIV